MPEKISMSNTELQLLSYYFHEIRSAFRWPMPMSEVLFFTDPTVPPIGPFQPSFSVDYISNQKMYKIFLTIYILLLSGLPQAAWCANFVTKKSCFLLKILIMSTSDPLVIVLLERSCISSKVITKLKYRGNNFMLRWFIHSNC